MEKVRKSFPSRQNSRKHLFVFSHPIPTCSTCHVGVQWGIVGVLKVYNFGDKCIPGRDRGLKLY